MSGEQLQQQDGLAEYRQIDPQIPLGQMPLAEYRTLREACGDIQELGPEAQYDVGWLDIELSMAMAREVNPLTGKPFTQKELNVASEQARADLRAVARNESSPPHLQALARLASASIGMYHEVARGTRVGIVGKNHLAYLRGIQASARELLAAGPETDADGAVLHEMTALVVFTEYSLDQGWFLPASSRQSWQINGVNRRNQSIARIVIGDEAPEGCIAIEVIGLGDELWSDSGYAPFATIETYCKLQAGFATQPGRPSFAKLALNEISDRLYYYLNRNLPTEETPEATDDADAALPPEPKQILEAQWFIAQSGHDLRDVQESALAINTRNMEELAAEGKLAAAESHTLGWMQIDHGRLLAMKSAATLQEAERERLQASRISRADAPAYIKRAEAAELRAAELAVKGASRFDAAVTSFTAAETITASYPGQIGTVLLDKEAAAVYKALFTETTPEAMAKATDTYTRRLAALFLRLRDTERTLKDTEQVIAVRAATLHATFCLLLTGSTDEAARHLALPASVRAGGSRGEIDATVFPIDFMNGGYDTSSAVNVQLKLGTEIEVDRHYVGIGLELLAPGGNAMPLLSKLAAVVRASKQGSKKREVRTEAIDNLTMRIADAVADASE